MGRHQTDVLPKSTQSCLPANAAQTVQDVQQMKHRIQIFLNVLMFARHRVTKSAGKASVFRFRSVFPSTVQYYQIIEQNL